MEKWLYPCVITEEDGVFYTQIVGVEEAFTDGKTITEAIQNTKDMLAGLFTSYAKHDRKIPQPAHSDLSLKPGEKLVFIDLWMTPIIDKARQQAVKKTLSVPKWLNDAAEKEGVNFSGVLQAALKETLGIL